MVADEWTWPRAKSITQADRMSANPKPKVNADTVMLQIDWIW